MTGLRLTADLVASVHRVEPEGPPTPGFTRMTDADYNAVTERYLAENGDGPIWTFAYGSLMWKPAFEHAEHVAATLFGYRRSFCLSMTNWRATVAQPGLMLALDRGGSCRGVVYRLADGDRFARMERLVRREIGVHEDLPAMRWLSVRAADGRQIRAFVSWVMPHDDPNYASLDLPEQAQRIARAAGHAGTCAEYLYNTVVALEDHGLRDSYLWRLQAMVADTIQSDAAAQAHDSSKEWKNGRL